MHINILHIFFALNCGFWVDAVVDAIIVIDAQGTVEIFNAAAERLFGYAAAEILGQNVAVLMPEPYRSEHDGYIRNYLATGIAKIIGVGRELAGRKKDGETFPMTLAIGEARCDGIRQFVGIIRDLGPRLRALAEIRRQQEDYRLIFESVPALIWYLDERSRVRRANPAVARVRPYRRRADPRTRARHH
jgi:two-component system sensor kinase FixL